MIKIISGADNRIRFGDSEVKLNVLLKDEYDLTIDPQLYGTLVSVLNQNEKISFRYDSDERTIGYNKTRGANSYHVLNLTKKKNVPAVITDMYLERFDAFIKWLNQIIEKEGT